MNSAEYIASIQAAGHLLKLDDDGEIDIFAMEYNYHNGPICELCHDAWCLHCQDTVEPCRAAAIETTCETIADVKLLPPTTTNAKL